MKEVTGIKILGRYFTEETTLNLFSNEANGNLPYAVLYGKNGSGKTTISDGIFHYKHPASEEYAHVDFIDNAANNIEVDKTKIHVFNENFIRDNVSVESEGINAIILFGEVIGIDEQIKTLKTENETLAKNIKDRNIDRFSTPKSPDCIEYYEKNIKNIVSNTYCNRIREIKGLSKKSPYKDSYLEDFKKMSKPSYKKSILADTYKELLANINKVRSIGDKVANVAIELTPIDEKEYLTHLNKVYVKKEFDSFGTKIFESLKNNPKEYLDETHELMENTGICPLCFQEVSKEHAVNVKKILDAIFDDTIKEEKSALSKLKIDTIEEFDFSSYENIIDAKLINDFNIVRNSLNEKIEEINLNIARKINQIYDSLNLESIGLNIKINEFNNVVSDVNKSINNYNSLIDNKEKNVNEINKINEALTYFEIELVMQKYKQLVSSYEDVCNLNDEDNHNIQLNNEKISNLNAQKKNYQIAIDEINSSLKLVLGTNQLLQLEPNKSGDKYLVKSRKHRVKQNKLSLGERNLISLIYFFEQIKSLSTKNNYYKDEMLIVIDDPVSSFDYNNQLGVIDYLRKTLIEIYKGNPNTKILIMSHEINVCKFIYSFMNAGVFKDKCNFIELYNKILIKIDDKKFSSYGQLMIEAFKFATGENKDDIGIGNKLRRILECFAKFNYNIDISSFFDNNFFVKDIKNEEAKKYFENRSFRESYNIESHGTDPLDSFAFTFDIDSMSYDDRVTLAKNTLLLLYCINESHVINYIGKNYEPKPVFRQWLNEIKK